MVVALTELKLNTTEKNRINLTYGVKNDYGSRHLKILLYAGKEKIDVHPLSSVSINAQRPDGQRKSFVGTIDGYGVIYIEIASWILAVKGEVECTVTVEDAKSRLTTTPFYIEVKDDFAGGEPEPPTPPEKPAVIDDSTVSLNKTWSSSKISEEISKGGGGGCKISVVDNPDGTVNIIITG